MMPAAARRTGRCLGFSGAITLLAVAAWSAGVAPDARADEKPPDWKQLAADPAFWQDLAARHPDFGAVILSRTGETEVQMIEGKFALVTTERLVQAIIDPSKPGVVTRWAFAETADRKVREIEGAAYRADGGVRKIDRKSVRDEAPYAAWGLYKDIRTKSVTAPDSGAHTIVDVGWRWVAGGGEGGGRSVQTVGSLANPQAVRGEDTGGGYVVHVHRFDDRVPVERSAYTIIYATELGTGGLAQRYVTSGPVPAAVTDKYFSPEGERQRLRWEMKDRSGLRDEPLAPPLADRAAFLALSPSGLTWSDLARVHHREQVSHALTMDKPVEARVAELTAGLATPGEKAAAIAKYVQTRVATVPVSLLEQGFEPHHARVVMEAGHGDSRDKSILAVTLLRGAGLRAWPVLVRTRPLGRLPEALVTLRFFDRMVVALELDGTRVWLDPARGHGIGDLDADVAGVKGLMLDEANAGLVDVGSAARGADRVTRVLRGTLSIAGDLEANFTLEASGGAADEIRASLADAGEERRADWLQGLFAPPLTPAGIEVSGLGSPAEPVVVKASLRGAVATPQAAGGLAWTPIAAKAKAAFPELPAGPRHAPVYITGAVTEVDSVTVTLPAPLRWAEGRRVVREASPAGRLVLDLRQDGAEFGAVRTIEVRRGEWPADNYERIRAFLEAIRARPDVVLEK